MGSGQMMPELGSRISLISKADIRYEGRLFTVDPQECTIALANVRSFGTEDRETAYPIMPQPTVYDYILFRGSDIKDIRVVNNVTIPNDPAIMQMQMNQQPGFPPQQMQQGPIGGGQFGPFGNLQGGPMGPPPSGNQNQAQSPQQAPQTTQSSPHQQSQQDSRSATPNQSRKSPTSDMGVQTSQRGGGENQGANKEKMQRNNNQRNNYNNNNNNSHQQYRRDSGRNDGYRNQRMPQQQQQHPQQQQQHNNNQQQRGGYNSFNKSRGGSGRMPMMRGSLHQNNFRQNNPQNRPNNPQNLQNKPPNKSLKFENEFDFEQGNSEFEELRSKLAKLKVGSEENKNPEQQVNGEVEKKDDSGNETADHDQPDDYNGYDKTKSFFDNISCEANERSKGKTQRTDWRQERKLNTETFGPTMNRRGGMRGRGGYYRNQYGRPMNYRGGGQQYRNNPNNRNRNNPQQGGRTNNSNNQGQQSQQSATTAAADK